MHGGCCAKAMKSDMQRNADAQMAVMMDIVIYEIE